MVGFILLIRLLLSLESGSPKRGEEEVDKHTSWYRHLIVMLWDLGDSPFQEILLILLKGYSLPRKTSQNFWENLHFHQCSEFEFSSWNTSTEMLCWQRFLRRTQLHGYYAEGDGCGSCPQGTHDLVQLIRQLKNTEDTVSVQSQSNWESKSFWLCWFYIISTTSALIFIAPSGEAEGGQE